MTLRLTNCDWNDNEVTGWCDGKRYSVWCYVDFSGELPKEIEVDEGYAFEINEFGEIIDTERTMIRIAHEAVDMVADTVSDTLAIDAQLAVKVALAWLKDGDEAARRAIKEAEDAVGANDAYDEDEQHMNWVSMGSIKDFVDDATSWLFYLSDLVK